MPVKGAWCDRDIDYSAYQAYMLQLSVGLIVGGILGLTLSHPHTWYGTIPIVFGIIAAYEGLWKQEES